MAFVTPQTGGYSYFLHLTYAQVHDQSSDLKILVNDAIAFVRYFADPITLSAPHVYISALTFAPKSSMIAQLYVPRFEHIIRVGVGQLDCWPVDQTTSCGHSWNVKFVLFSPYVIRVVTCSDDNTILISYVDTV